MGKWAAFAPFLLLVSGCSSAPEGFEQEGMTTYEPGTRYRVEELSDGFRIYVSCRYSDRTSKRNTGEAALLKIAHEELERRRKPSRPIAEGDFEEVDSPLELWPPVWYGKLRIYWDP